MQSEVDFNSKFPLWSKNIWMGKFKASWVFVKDVPNTEFIGIKTESDHRNITGCKDCTEISFANGLEIYKIIQQYPDSSSVLDMFDEYDTKERTDKDSKPNDEDYEMSYEKKRSNRRYRRRMYEDDS